MTPERRAVWPEWLVLSAIVAAVLAVYLRTLFPGVGGPEDSPKLQYVGRVLGTPHEPGYPLYVMVSHLFSRLPFGSLAYRINVMSACFATLAAAVTYGTARLLDCRRAVAVATALGLAFGQALWSKAVVAEVYTLSAALVALVAYFLVRWSRTREDRGLFWAAAMYGLSLGNHLTVAFLAPAIALYVLTVDRHRALRVRTLAVCAGLIAAGVAQYGFIWLRTVQGAAYLEAKATNLRELVDVMRAARFSHLMFAFDGAAFLNERLPLMGELAAAEFGALGLVFLALGALFMLRRLMPEAILFGLGVAAMALLAINLVGDVSGFLVPTFALVWPVAAVGFEESWRALTTRTRWAGVVVAAAAVLIPLTALSRSYAFNDHSDRTYEIDYLEALVREAPDRTVIVSEMYWVDQLVFYKLLGEQRTLGKTILTARLDPVTIADYQRQGFAVYAFSRSATELSRRGFRFQPVQLRVPGTGEPIAMGHLPLFVLVASAPCLDIGDGAWQDISPTTAGGRLMLRIDNFRAFDSRIVLYVAAPTELDPWLAGRLGYGRAESDVAHFAPAEQADRQRLLSSLARDGLDASEALTRESHVYRIDIRANDEGELTSLPLELGGQPQAAWARALMDIPAPRRAGVCGWAADLFAEPDQRAHRIVPDEEAGALFADGWQRPEQDPFGTRFRWTSAPEASLLVALARRARFRVTVRASRAVLSPGGDRVSLIVNGTLVGEAALSRSWQSHEWPTSIEHWREGFNVVALRVNSLFSPGAGDGRQLGVAVSEVRLEIGDPSLR